MADKEDVRIGRVSAINYEAGTISVVYEDRDGSVTKDVPMLSHEYMMPEEGDMVQVSHLSNGAEYAVCMGRFWNEENPPQESGRGIYRKDFSRTNGAWDGSCYLKYDQKSKTLTLFNEGPIIIKGSRIDLNP